MARLPIPYQPASPPVLDDKSDVLSRAVWDEFWRISNALTPATKPAVTGSRGGNAALASLLTQLADLGIITDSTTP